MKEAGEGPRGLLPQRVYGFLYRYFTACVKSTRLLAMSRRLWPFPFWLRFWTSRDEELKVTVDSLQFYVRSRRLHLKLTDLYMITSCVISEQYNSEEAFRIGENDVVIDVGAHIGSFSVYAARKAAKGRVLSFEPDEASYGQFVKNIQANNLKNILAFKEAVGGQPGPRTLYSAKLNSAENNFYWGGARARSVACGTLSEVFTKNGIARCDFLKMDCEGAEYEILLNTPIDVLRKIRRIGVECHVGPYFGLREPSAVPKTLVGLLKRAGFVNKVWKENSLHTFIWARLGA